MNASISINDIFKQSEGNIVSNMGQEKVMLNVEKGKYYNLGELGGLIWEYIESPMSVKDLCETLMKEYNVEKEICEEQTLIFLNHLYTEGLIEKQQLIELP